MVFSSLLFLFCFLPIVLVVYNIMPNLKWKNIVLFVFSLFFYAWGEPIYVLLMLFSTVSDFFHGKYIYKYKENKKKSVPLLISAIIINLLALGFFKYSDFLIGIMNSVFGSNIPLLNLPLPIGISFYTFQTMSYSMDIYMGRAKPQKSILDFGLYVTLFPQLIAGPIVTYNQVAEELTCRTPNYKEGVERFIIGLAKKVLLANNMGILWDTLRESSTSMFGAWLGIIAFAFQIYFDFSGYSDMAIGLGKCFGFNFLENFNHPYISKSITEFWRRWHISLGSWFRDYVYIPLGGNRKGFARQILNISIVWLLTGIWHGAFFNYIMWGIYFGVILIIEKLFLLKLLQKMPVIISHIYSLFLILIGWAIFAIEDLDKLWNYLKSMFMNPVFIDNLSLFEVANNWFLLIVCTVTSIGLTKKLYEKASDNLLVKNVILLVLTLASICYLASSTYNPFLYFRF